MCVDLVFAGHDRSIDLLLNYMRYMHLHQFQNANIN